LESIGLAVERQEAGPILTDRLSPRESSSSSSSSSTLSNDEDEEEDEDETTSPLA
jgi:hypothetical protein